jgi:hypothetical protein
VIERTLRGKLEELAGFFPVVTVVGPRQSGKTTLARAAFSRHRYTSLEAPDVLEFAHSDPRGFLAPLRDGAILDEIQRCPELLSYLQGEVDEDPRPGRFILTGSANLSVLAGVSQSLAGRAAVLELLPCSYEEVVRFPGPPRELFEVLWAGGYPAVFDRGIPPPDWYRSYLATYVERDVRTLLNIGDLLSFQTFLRLCAGRVGQLVNFSSLAADAGITHNTARAWVSVLEASFLVFRLPPWHANVRKRLVKTPKLYFFDTGLAAALLGVRDPRQLPEHPLRGALFENWVVGQVVTARLHRGLPPAAFFYRERNGFEVDLVIEVGEEAMAVECKSGATVSGDAFFRLEALCRRLGEAAGAPRLRRCVVYGGEEGQQRRAGEVIPWRGVAQHRWW